MSNFNTSLNAILHRLERQRDDYLSLLQENTSLRNEIENLMIYNHQNTQQRQPLRAQPPPSFTQPNTTPLSATEVLNYTQAITYENVIQPLNSTCPLSGIQFRNNESICKLPCGHLFSGSHICYHLTHVSSLCPTCNANVRTESSRSRQSHQTANSRFVNNQMYSLIDQIYSNLLNVDVNDYIGTNLNVPQTNDRFPTNEEIQNATELIAYENIDDPLNEECPISYESFEPETIVRRIKHCKHIFKPEALNRWFESSSKCPVCRYDIHAQSRDASGNHVNTNTDASGNATNRTNVYRYRIIYN